MKSNLSILVLGLLASSAFAGMTYFLTSQWVEKGNQMCRYGNGTVLNVGVNVCPLSIKG